MKRGDIYLVERDPVAGHEQSGSRPVLVVSASKFNEVTKLPVTCPITSDFVLATAWDWPGQIRMCVLACS